MRGKGVPFVKGDKRAGRQRGSRSFVSSSVRGAFLHLADVAPELFEQAILKGLKAKPPRSFPYVQLAAYYLDGKPVERVMLQGTTRMLFLPGGARVDGFGAGYVWDAKSTKGTTNPNARCPLKDGYYDHGQNCVENIALMFGPGTKRQVVLPEAAPPIFPFSPNSWMGI